MNEKNISGIVGINKIKGISSHAVINKVRRITGIRKVGHGGTLDPLASGVLVVAIGRENTKKIEKFVKKEKEYEVVIKFGFNSETGDEEGEKTEIDTNYIPEISEIKKVVGKYIGQIEQMPPLYSAIKIHGKPAYKYARKGKEVILKKRKVEIRQIDILSYDYPYLKMRVVCGPGVYIRSLAYDLGKDLKIGAYITELIRTRVGEFKIEDVIDLSLFEIEKKRDDKS